MLKLMDLHFSYLRLWRDYLFYFVVSTPLPRYDPLPTINLERYNLSVPINFNFTSGMPNIILILNGLQYFLQMEIYFSKTANYHYLISPPIQLKAISYSLFHKRGSDCDWKFNRLC
jgi:hypothetical protein